MQSEGSHSKSRSHELNMESPHSQLRTGTLSNRSALSPRGRRLQPPLDEEVDRRGVRGGAGSGSQHWLEKALLFPRLRISGIKGAKAVAGRAHGQIPWAQFSLRGH